MVPTAEGNSFPNDYIDIQIGSGVSLPELVVLTNYVTGGNGNGLIDPNECNSMDIVLTNAGSTNASGLQTTLYTTTPGVLIGQRYSAFPDILANASGTNLTSFTISTSPLFVCGSRIDFLLVIKSDQALTTNAFSVNTATPGPVVRFDNSSFVFIPDADPAGANSTIVVTNISSAIYKVSVALNIAHTFDADLALELIGPDGTKVSLARSRGGSGDNYGLDCFSDSDRTTFDDGSSNSIVGANAPFVGVFRPEEPLAAFSGKAGTNVNGSWRLHVVDQTQTDVGAIQCWTLKLQTAACVDGGGQCPGADLAVAMQTIPDRGTIGSNLTYSITVTNSGPDNTKGVALNQTLPGSVIFVSASSSQGTITHSGTTVSCNLGNLDVGGTATMTVVVLPTTSGTIFSTASVGAVQSDPDLSNNSATIGTLIEVPTADLAVALVGTPNPALLGGVLNYTVTVTQRPLIGRWRGREQHPPGEHDPHLRSFFTRHGEQQRQHAGRQSWHLGQDRQRHHHDRRAAHAARQHHRRKQGFRHSTGSFASQQHRHGRQPGRSGLRSAPDHDQSAEFDHRPQQHHLPTHRVEPRPHRGNRSEPE